VLPVPLSRTRERVPSPSEAGEGRRVRAAG
jgi:hypothetical protein